MSLDRSTSIAVAVLENPPILQRGLSGGSLAETLRRGYGGVKPDLVIVVIDPSLQLRCNTVTRFSGCAHRLYVMSAATKGARWGWPGVTGVFCPLGIRETIDLALRLHPKTNTVAVITNVSEFENYWLAAVHFELLRHQDKVREIDLVAPSADQIFAEGCRASSAAVVLFQLGPQWLQFSQQSGIMTSSHGSDNACLPIASSQRYVWIMGASAERKRPGNDALLGSSTGEHGCLTARRPENIPVVHDLQSSGRVDWRHFRRWHIPESALPQGSVILYREPTLWERYRKYMIAAIAVIAAQALLIIGLLWQRARKRKAEAGLRESEKRFRVMADTTPCLVWMCDRARQDYLSE